MINKGARYYVLITELIFVLVGAGIGGVLIARQLSDDAKQFESLLVAGFLVLGFAIDGLLIFKFIKTQKKRALVEDKILKSQEEKERLKKEINQEFKKETQVKEVTNRWNAINPKEKDEDHVKS